MNLFCFFICSGIFGFQAHAQNNKQVVLAVGSSQTLQARGAVHFSNNRILKATDLGSRIRVSGKAVGEVDVQFKDGSYHFEVLRPSEYRLYSRLEELIHNMRGLSVKIHNGQIQVTGELLRKSDWIKLAQSQTESARYQFLAKVDDAMKAEMMAYFQKLLHLSELPPASLQIDPVAQISLAKSMLGLRSKYEKVLGAYGFVVEQNSSILQLEPLVRVNILVAEVRKSLSRTLGINPAGVMKAKLLPSLQAPAEGEDVTAQINAMESQGNGHLLAAPTLLCRSGKKAEFLAGGEIPIKMISLKYHETVWKRYGVLLKVSPLADSTGRMSIALSTEVSMLDPTHSIDGVPALLTNRIESHFDLKKSRTIALSGLLKNEWFRNSEGLPWLSQIPILGYLFSSKEYKNSETELIIFVTPEVLQPESMTEEDS